jgi:hypothetical protein
MSFAECGQIESEEFAEEFAITLEGNPKGVHTSVNAARKVRALPAYAERSKRLAVREAVTEPRP